MNHDIGKTARAILVAVLAVVVGTAMARGLPHHAAAPPPPAASSGGQGSRVGYDVLALLVVGGLIVLAIRLWHKRKMRELHMAEARLDGFVNVRHSQLSDLWRCTECHALILLADIDDHQEVSACAAYQHWLAESETAGEDLGPPEWAAAEVVNPAAMVPPEHSVTAGGVDTFEEIDP